MRGIDAYEVHAMHDDDNKQERGQNASFISCLISYVVASGLCYCFAQAFPLVPLFDVFFLCWIFSPPALSHGFEGIQWAQHMTPGLR